MLILNISRWNSGRGLRLNILVFLLIVLWGSQKHNKEKIQILKQVLRENSEKSIKWASKTNKKFKTKDIAFKERVKETDKQSKYIAIYLYNTQIKNEKEIGRTKTH